MATPRAFSCCCLPQVADAALTCVGVRLDGDARGWIDAAAPFTTEREKARARRFVHAMDAARHLMGRALVRRTLAAVPHSRPAQRNQPAWEDFPCSPWGKPLCPHEGASGRGAPDARTAVDFSISHSGTMVWAAFCRGGCVGIDVEETRAIPDIAELAAQLHPREREGIRSLAASERTAAFYRCWTRKEAVLKALGKGLGLPLHDFQVDTGPAATDWLLSPPREKHRAGEDFDIAPGSVTRGSCTSDDVVPDDAAPDFASPDAPPDFDAAAPLYRTVRQHDSDAWTTSDIPVGAGYQCSAAATVPHLPLAVFLLENDCM